MTFQKTVVRFTQWLSGIDDNVLEVFRMIRVHAETSDKITAWRVRDRLAVHPLLATAAVQIDVLADHECIALIGWAADARLLQLAEQLSRRVAGHRSLSRRIDNGFVDQGCFEHHATSNDVGVKVANTSLT